MLNKAIVMGRLTADPELRRTQSSTSVTSFSLAVNRSFTRPGEQAQTDFLDIVAWGKTAEFVSQWFHKGMLVAVSGRLQVRNWEDKQGQKRKSVEIVAEEVHFAEPKRDSQPSQPKSEFAPSPFDMRGGGNEFNELPDDDGELPF